MGFLDYDLFTAPYDSGECQVRSYFHTFSSYTRRYTVSEGLFICYRRPDASDYKLKFVNADEEYQRSTTRVMRRTALLIRTILWWEKKETSRFNDILNIYFPLEYKQDVLSIYKKMIRRRTVESIVFDGSDFYQGCQTAAELQTQVYKGAYALNYADKPSSIHFCKAGLSDPLDGLVLFDRELSCKDIGNTLEAEDFMFASRYMIHELS